MSCFWILALFMYFRARFFCVVYHIKRPVNFFVLFVVKHHYTGNKSRNALVRQDFPHALDEQRREEEEAASLQAMYHQMVHQQLVVLISINPLPNSVA
jgi:hypothetical protein